MNPFNIRQPQDRRKVYNEYISNLQMQIDNLAKTEAAVATLALTGIAPVQPTDTRTLSEKLLDVEAQRKVLQKALIGVTDGAEASKIMNTISDQDVVFLGVAWEDFSKMIKQKFAAGILAPLFNEVLQRYKRDYINSMSVQKGISAGHTTEELLLSMRDLMRLMPNAAQLNDLTFTINNIGGSAPPRMVSSALSAIGTLGSVLPTESMIAALDRMNPIDRAAAERAINDGLSSIASGADLQILTQKLQQARPEQVPDVLTTIINDILLTRDDKAQLQQAMAIAEERSAAFEATRQEEQAVAVQESRKASSARTAFSEMAEPEVGVAKAPRPVMTAQQEYDLNFIETNPIEEVVKIRLEALKWWVGFKIREGAIPPVKGVAKMPKNEILQIVADYKAGKLAPSPPPKARKAYTKKATAATATPFVQVLYDPAMSVRDFDLQDYADKRSILEDMERKGIIVDNTSPDQFKEYKNIMNRNEPKEEATLIEIYKDMRQKLGMGGNGLKKGKRIAFGCGLARAMKPTMTVRPDNIDLGHGIKKEASYIPVGKYVVNKHKLRDNVLLMRTVKGGQIAELPQMSVSPKLGKMLNRIVNGYGFPSHGDLTDLEDGDKDILYKVFKMSKAEGIEAIPRPNKSKDEAEFNRFTILKGQIIAGNNSKELIKEFKSLLVKLIHSDKILRKDGHAILLDLAALGY